MAKRTYLISAAALTLLAACNGSSGPEPTPRPRPVLETAPADLPPPPPLLGGPAENTSDDGTLLGGPYATADKPGPLTTFRRPDGVEVTVMRPIPNPEDGGPIPPRHRTRDRIGDLLAAQAARDAAETNLQQPEAVAPVVRSAPEPKAVERSRRAAPPQGAHHRIQVRPPSIPTGVTPPPAANPAKPSLVDRLSEDKLHTPAGETTPKSLLGGALLLAAMVLLVAIARRMARAREARDKARRAAKRAATEPPAPETPAAPAPVAETPPEPKPES